MQAIEDQFLIVILNIKLNFFSNKKGEFQEDKFTIVLLFLC